MPSTTTVHVREVAELAGLIRGRADAKTVRRLLDMVNRLRTGGEVTTGDEALMRALRQRYGGELDALDSREAV